SLRYPGQRPGLRRAPAGVAVPHQAAASETVYPEAPAPEGGLRSLLGRVDTAHQLGRPLLAWRTIRRGLGVHRVGSVRAEPSPRLEARSAAVPRPPTRTTRPRPRHTGLTRAV